MSSIEQYQIHWTAAPLRLTKELTVSTHWPMIFVSFILRRAATSTLPRMSKNVPKEKSERSVRKIYETKKNARAACAHGFEWNSTKNKRQQRLSF